MYVCIKYISIASNEGHIIKFTIRTTGNYRLAILNCRLRFPGNTSFKCRFLRLFSFTYLLSKSCFSFFPGARESGSDHCPSCRAKPSNVFAVIYYTTIRQSSKFNVCIVIITGIINNGIQTSSKNNRFRIHSSLSSDQLVKITSKVSNRKVCMRI